MPLLDLSHKFGVTTLKEECGLLLFNAAEVKNIAFFLDIAQKFNCSLLETCCANYMVFCFLLPFVLIDELGNRISGITETRCTCVSSCVHMEGTVEE